MNVSKTYLLEDIKKEELPKDIGIYAWIEKESNSIVYIGTATSKYGLYQRIWNQHLNPNYLETRKHVISEQDIYQIENPIYHNGKLAIDKSSFRRKLARRYLLLAGHESVEFIKKHFSLSICIYPPDEREKVVHRGKMLINTHQPFYNGRFQTI